MALLQTNATVSVSRNGAALPTMQSIGVYLKPASPMNLDFQGAQITTDFLGDNFIGSTWQVNDTIIVSSDGNYQVTQYTVCSVEPPRGLLPVWRNQLRGAVR